MQITPVTNDTGRQTGNQAWPGNRHTLSSSKIESAAIDLKGLMQRDMAAPSIARANSLCNIILGEVDAVRGLETVANLGGPHGQE